QLPPARARNQLLLVGGGLSLAFYGVALGASYAWQDDPGSGDLRIPFVGPWLKVGQTSLCAELPAAPGRTCNDPLQVIGGVLSVFVGLGQLGSAVLLLEGALMKVDSGRPATGRPRLQLRASAPAGPFADGAGGFVLGKVRFWPTPYAAPTAAGLGLIGQF